MNVAIVQARMGSARLPGKVLYDLSGAPVVAHVIGRAKAIPGIDRVCCAIPESAENDDLAVVAQKAGAQVCRGPEADVLFRYLIAARQSQAQAIMRITCDCPLLDSNVSGLVLDSFLAGGADYVSNVCPPSWPKGLDTEVFSLEALELAAAKAKAPYDREHVTPWLQRAADVSSRNVSVSAGEFAHWRWTLDYEEDLAFLRAALSHAPPFPYFPGFEEVRAIIDAHPEIAAINAGLQ